MYEILRSSLFVLVIFISACTDSTSQKTNAVDKEIMSRDTCNSPDADVNCCFVNAPDEILHVMKIGDGNEHGEKLILTGTIFMKDSITPFAGVLLYAYHTNNEGIYAKSGKETGIQKWHGKLHGWCKTDSKGRYEIHTTRPASYPNSTLPAHIHPAIKLPNNNVSFYINDFVFTDDPFVTNHYRNNLYYKVGGSGIVELTRKADHWYGERDIILNE